jgi:hypothetical protein
MSSSAAPQVAAPAAPGSNTPLIIGGIVFLIILLGAAYYFYFMEKDTSDIAGAASSTLASAPVTATPVSPSPAPASGTSGYIGPSNGSDYPGNDLGNWSNADPSFCADKCNTTPGCVGFIVSTTGQGCYAKSKFENPVNSSTSNVYSKPDIVLPDAAAKYQAPITGHYMGTDTATYANIDPNFCATKCNASTGCVAFETDTTNCVIKSKITDPLDTTRTSTKVYKKTGATIAPFSSTGQALLTTEAEISASPPAFTTPTGVPTSGAVSYTLSMSVKIAQAGSSWRNIMNHGDPDCCGSTTRRPAIFITGNDAAPPNRVHVVHGASGDENKNITTSFAATPGTYFNLIMVVDSGTLKTYINGALDSAGTATGNFTWNDGGQLWRWNAYLSQMPGRAANTEGSVKVKNVYWWNRPLTATEITSLASSP